MHRFRIWTLLWMLSALVLGACGGAADPTLEPPSSSGGGGPVYVDETSVVIRESFPMQLALEVKGHLPTPCHELRWTVEGPNEDGEIRIEMISVATTDEACIQVLEPFETGVELGSYTEGSFSIFLNGELVQEVDL